MFKVGCWYTAASCQGCVERERVCWLRRPTNRDAEFFCDSVCLHYTAMGALSEESAVAVSSLSADLWNNWIQNNTKGISSLFCLSLFICHLEIPPQNPSKIYYDVCCYSAAAIWALSNLTCRRYLRLIRVQRRSFLFL